MNYEELLREQWLLTAELSGVINGERLFVDELPVGVRLPAATIRRISQEPAGGSSDERYQSVSVQVRVWDVNFQRGESLLASLQEAVAGWQLSGEGWRTQRTQSVQLQREKETDRWRWELLISLSVCVQQQGVAPELG